MSNDVLQRWSSRKWLTMVGAIALFTGLLLGEVIDQGAYMALVLPTIGSYFAGNVTASIWGKR